MKLKVICYLCKTNLTVNCDDGIVLYTELQEL